MIAQNLFECLAYLHSKDIVHGTVRSSKLIIESQKYENINFRLVDFGRASHLPVEEPDFDSLIIDSFVAPEVVLQQQYDDKIDVWGATVVIF